MITITIMIMIMVMIMSIYPEESQLGGPGLVVTLKLLSITFVTLLMTPFRGILER